jgi:hypothetical protein
MKHNHYKIKIGYIHYTVIVEQTDDKTDNELSTYIGTNTDTLKGEDLDLDLCISIENKIRSLLNLEE